MTRLKGLLVASVAINLFALGAISSFFITRPYGPPPMGGPIMDPIRGPLIGPHDLDAVLTAEGIAVRNEVLPAAHPQVLQAIDALRAARGQALEIAAAPTLDREALQQALNDARAADERLSALSQEVIIALLTRLSDADRIAVSRLARERVNRTFLSPPLPHDEMQNGMPSPPKR